MKEFINGFLDCVRAFGFIKKYKMMRFYLWVFLGSIALMFFSIFWLYDFSGWLTDVFFEKIANLFNIPFEKKESGWILKSAGIMLGIVLRIFSIFVFIKFSKYVYLIVFSPLFAYVSEIAEEKLYNKKYPFRIFKIFKDALRGIIVSIRNLIIELILSLGAFILILIFPILSLPISILLLFISFYYFGFAMLDYNHERWGLPIQEGIKLVRKQKYRAMGIGSFYYVATLIPFIGWIFAGVNGAVGAVLGENKSNNEEK